ncbi:MAG: TetR/AcrR family transcriptional regulator [Burkholderiaceae bacterium]|nr:TetR/AcrR family transcriptional regulator [Microbacteriaceae bacterium]
MTVKAPESAITPLPRPGDSGQPGSGAKQRILETANRLFYAQGIHSVGVDKLISESSVTKATFYKHYGAKDKLIIEYLNTRHRAVEEFLDTAAQTSSADDVIRALIDQISVDIHQSDFRGCPFINAAAEFADPRHPVRGVVEAHRDWYTERLTSLLRECGHPMPGDAADDLLLARDGAMTGGYAGDPVSTTAALARVVEHILTDAHLSRDTEPASA